MEYNRERHGSLNLENFEMNAVYFGQIKLDCRRRHMLENLIKLKEQIEEYQPFNEQEEKDKKEILRQICESDQILTRDNKNAHITVSAWIVDKERKKVLMAYHNIYQSWAWLGGHADGNDNLKEVILKEIEEESGLQTVSFVSDDIFSLEILTVSGHEKRGEYVSSHLHLNVTYLLEADINSPIRIKEDENSQIGWIDVEEIDKKSTEKWFVDRIYSKLCKKAAER